MPVLTAEGRDGTVRQVVIGPRLGRGGEGEVFGDAHLEERVVKLFAPDLAAAKAAKIAAMLARAPAGEVESHGGRDIVQIAWPLESVRNAAGEFRGFTMRAVDFSASAILNGLSSASARRRNGLPEDYRFRVYAARNLAALVGHLHAAGHQIIDTKPQNIRVYKEGAFVCLLDCDGYAVTGPRGRYPALVRTPEFLAPEAFDLRPEELGEPQDRFGLAVLIFELLANGVHPASGRDLRGGRPPDVAARARQRLFFIDPGSRLAPPFSSIYDHLPEETRALFGASFLGEAEARPTALTWVQHLDGLIGRLHPCEHDPEHFHAGVTCPWCALGLRQADRLRNASRPAAVETRAGGNGRVGARFAAPDGGSARHRASVGWRRRRGSTRRRTVILAGAALVVTAVLSVILGEGALHLGGGGRRLELDGHAVGRWIRGGSSASVTTDDIATSSLAPQLAPAQVTRAKVALESLGFEPGPIDPTLDERFVLAWRRAAWQFGEVTRGEDAAAVLDRLERRASLERETNDALLALGIATNERTALLAKVSESLGQGDAFVAVSGRLLRLLPAEGCLELQPQPADPRGPAVRLCGLEGGGVYLCRVDRCVPRPAAGETATRP